jgi:hypothetical protein
VCESVCVCLVCSRDGVPEDSGDEHLSFVIVHKHSTYHL